MAKTTELEAAYRATTYRVFLPGGVCDLRPGVASETLRCWLETAGANSFAILTAHNPGSSLIDPEQNVLRQAQLECDLLESGYEPYAGENVADVMALAAPLRLGAAVLGVAIAGPIHRMQVAEPRLTDHLMSALAAIRTDEPR